MNGTWTSADAQRTATPAPTARPERYDDISLLLAHEQLDGFIYQSFRSSANRPAAAVLPAPGLITLAAASAAQVAPTLPEATLPATLPSASAHALRTSVEKPVPAPVAAKAPLAVLATVTPRHESSDCRALFERLSNSGAVVAAQRPALDLRLPSRPVVPRSGSARGELIDLPRQRAFARLRDTAPLCVAAAG